MTTGFENKKSKTKASFAPNIDREDIEEYGHNKQEWLKTFLELPFGIPSPDTFRRVFERINPKEFEQCF